MQTLYKERWGGGEHMNTQDRKLMSIVATGTSLLYFTCLLSRVAISPSWPPIHDPPASTSRVIRNFYHLYQLRSEPTLHHYTTRLFPVFHWWTFISLSSSRAGRLGKLQQLTPKPGTAQAGPILNYIRLSRDTCVSYSVSIYLARICSDSENTTLAMLSHFIFNY